MKVIVFLSILAFFCNIVESQKIGSDGKLQQGAKKADGGTNKPAPTGKDTPGSPTVTPTPQRRNNAYWVLDSPEGFCQNNPLRPFYQRISDGAVCCRGRELPVVTLQPETTGECAISTKTDKDGMLDSAPLWCSYTCSLKKLGIIDAEGKVVPEKFFDHLTQGLTASSKARLRSIMENYLKCFKPMENKDLPCYTPLGFQKCYQDALIVLCTYGAPKSNDFSNYTKVSPEYETMKPFCYYNGRRATPGCCHGRPLPWTITEILEAPRNQTQMDACLSRMGEQCDATCFLQSLNVVNDDFDLDVDKFSKNILNNFPTVKPSAWMDYTGPVFLFYDEVLFDMGDEVYASEQRVCRFHDRVMELHESKVEQYCEMTAAEVKELVKV